LKKAINFDIDTKKYKNYTKKSASTAYEEIKRFLKKNGFNHRQGSGYVSKTQVKDWEVMAIIMKMSIQLKWLKYCVKEMDVTNIGKQYSMINVINEASKKLNK